MLDNVESISQANLKVKPSKKAFGESETDKKMVKIHKFLIRSNKSL